MLGFSCKFVITPKVGGEPKNLRKMAIITKEQLAQRLDRMEYGTDITGEEKRDAIESGLLIITGQSDDIISFDGTLYDEADAYEGGTVYISPSGAIKKKTKNPDAIKVTAEWCPKDVECSWRITTSAASATFRIVDGSDLYCIGCIIDYRPKE